MQIGEGPNMTLRVLLAFAVLICLATTADAARKKKARIAPQPPPPSKVVRPPVDKFMSCDVRVRDYLREGGAAVRVKKIEVDDARLQLNIHHEYGQAGKSNRRFLRGESEEEMRRTLHAILEEFRAAENAAVAGRAWYVIAARKVLPMADTRSGSAESTSPWVAVVLADIEGKCRPVAFYDSVNREKLDPELSKRLEE
jgi:hypothetical protein